MEKIKHNAFHRYIVSLNNNELQKEVFDFLSLNQQEIEVLRGDSEGKIHPQLAELLKDIKVAILP